jgi:hypothetical protein
MRFPDLTLLYYLLMEEVTRFGGLKAAGLVFVILSVSCSFGITYGNSSADRKGFYALAVFFGVLATIIGILT